MALTDVSTTITLFQRLCQFAEEFTEEHRDAMAAALNNLFRSDREEGEEAPDVHAMIRSLLRRLRNTLANMMLAETELLGAFKENAAFRDFSDQLFTELRQVFDRARVECRNHFSRAIADSAGFPARLATDPGALLRQIKLVSWTLRKPDFELGESVIPGSLTTKESLLAIFEPKAEEFENVRSSAVRRRAKARGKQVAKNQEVADFRATYSIFVGLIRGSFRLAGQRELSNRLTLIQIGRRAASPSQPTTPSDTPPDDPSSDDPPVDDPPADDPPADNPPVDDPPVDDPPVDDPPVDDPSDNGDPSDIVAAEPTVPE